MLDYLKTLKIIYDIVSSDPEPLTYKCRQRKIILHQNFSWTSLEQDLKILEKEGFINLRKEDTVVIFITAAGIEKIGIELKANGRQ